MPKDKNYDIGGWATKYNVRCTDGRLIKSDAFKHMDGQVLPMVWQHNSNDPGNIVGHVELEHREEGVYAYGYFNTNPNTENVKSLVMHKAVNAFSIYANKLNQVGTEVIHGIIREVSLVMSGANPGAHIDTLSFAHSEFDEPDEIDEAFIYSGETFSHSEEPSKKEDEKEKKEDPEELEHEEKERTLGDVLATLNEEQQAAVGALIDEMLSDEDAEHSDKEESMKNKRNVFDQTGGEEVIEDVLTHADFESVMDNARRCGSFKEALATFVEHSEELQHAGTYGLDNIGVLFPDAKNLTPTPEWVKRDTGWVSIFLGGTRHTPFSRIKTTSADITADEARAKGYVTGNEKTEEVFGLLSRTTTPTTVYKKQKLDRDDILDVSDFAVVAWLKAEMRMMLDEEIARAGLIGDGRAVDSPDKIKEDKIRPIYKDALFYTHRVTLAADNEPSEDIDDVVRSKKYYKGSGQPVLFATIDWITDLLLEKDTLGRRLYNTLDELANAMRVSRIVEVEVMENVTRTDDNGTYELMGIYLNMNDYTYGADKGGDVNSFEDFDIDFNQEKYLIETRCSGALTKPKSAVVIERVVTPPAQG
jgi:hypothetical protein